MKLDWHTEAELLGTLSYVWPATVVLYFLVALNDQRSFFSRIISCSQTTSLFLVIPLPQMSGGRNRATDTKKAGREGSRSTARGRKEPLDR